VRFEIGEGASTQSPLRYFDIGQRLAAPLDQSRIEISCDERLIFETIREKRGVRFDGKDPCGLDHLE